LLKVMLILLGLLGLTVQTLVVQTHVHYFAGRIRTPVAAVSILGLDSPAVAGERTEGSATPSRDDNRGTDDPANCPLCQAFAHFSQFTHGVALFLVPLFLSTTHNISLDGALPSFAAVTHSWYSRGPPLHTTNLLEP
jgi:hypothetical protein